MKTLQKIAFILQTFSILGSMLLLMIIKVSWLDIDTVVEKMLATVAVLMLTTVALHYYWRILQKNFPI